VTDRHHDERAPTPSARFSNEGLVAWAFVGVQMLLLALLVLLPSASDWSMPEWLALASNVGSVAGIALMVVAAVLLRRGLTAVPLPNAHARLRTGGPYRYVRHPVYSGLLLFTSALVVSSRSWKVVVVGASLVVVINVKARWEERRLLRHFPDYGDYARRTSRFVPGWPGR